KAGIIKRGVPVIIGETHPETRGVFEETAREKQATIYFADQLYQIHTLDFDTGSNDRPYEVVRKNERKIFRLDLMGDYQQKNLAGILQAIFVLKEQGLKIPEEAVRSGLSHVVKNTGLKGRWQKLGEDPLVYCDTGHNAAGLKLVLGQIARIPHNNLFFVLGM